MRCAIDYPVDSRFPYRAVVPWPIDVATDQRDWISSVDTLEVWLNAHIGPSHWQYVALDPQAYCQACVAFRRAPDRTMFVLRWAN